MNRRSRSPSPASQQGVVLLESLIAILIFSLGVLGIVGLQATMIKSTTEAKYRSEASYIAQQRIARMRVAAGLNANGTPNDALLDPYLEVATDISSLLPGGTRTVSRAAIGAPYVVTVTWQQPGEPQHNFTTAASIVGG